MLTVSSIVVRTFSIDQLDLFWTIEDTEEEVEAYDFYLLRSIDGAAGPYSKIAGPFYNTYTFRDTDVHLLHRWRNYFYMMKVVHRESQREEQFGPVRLEAPPDRIALEIRRRERLLFSEFVGRINIFYPALTFGQKCVHCWDRGPKGNYIGRQQQQNCFDCFDTSYVGGYATPIIVHAQIDPYTKVVQRTDVAERQFTETTARMSNFPPAKPKDMIVEAENIRWRIEHVSGTRKLGAVVHQELKLRQYPPGDIKHKVPVNFDLLTEHGPSRAYTRPMDLQAKQVEKVSQDVEIFTWF